MLLGQVQTEARFIHLHPVCPGRRQFNQHFLVHANQRLRDSCPTPSRAMSFAQQRQRYRTKQHWARCEPECFRFEELLDWFAAGETELHSWLELGDDVVIIRVEPLGHFHRRGGLVPARHGEIRG